jgi:hypothetical protein
MMIVFILVFSGLEIELHISMLTKRDDRIFTDRYEQKKTAFKIIDR